MKLTQSVIDTLQYWFEQNIPRSGTAVWNAQLASKEEAIAAAQLYKRGLAKLVDEQNNLIFESPDQPFQSLIPALLFSDSKTIMNELKHKLQTSFVIFDSGFLHYWPEWLKFHEENSSRCLVISPTEDKKTIFELLKLQKQLPDEPVETLFSIGGGIVSDMTGLLAGLLNCNFISVPTTLLAAVDASIGGKTAVNYFPYGKNQVGLFYGAAKIVVAPEFFSSLTEIDFLCGIAEALKHSWIAGTFAEDWPHFDQLLEHKSNSDTKIVKSLIEKNYAIKSAIVKADPLEKNIRKILNFGHTLAHLIESMGQNKIIPNVPHGIAVAMGMHALLEKNWVNASTSEFNEALIRLFNEADIALPLTPNAQINPSIRESILQLLSQDKKNTAGNMVQFVLPAYGCAKNLIKSENKDVSIDSQNIGLKTEELNNKKFNSSSHLYQLVDVLVSPINIQ